MSKMNNLTSDYWHREDGPFMITSKHIAFWVDNMSHNQSGPAIMTKDGQYIKRSYAIFDKLIIGT